MKWLKTNYHNNQIIIISSLYTKVTVGAAHTHTRGCGVSCFPIKQHLPHRLLAHTVKLLPNFASLLLLVV